MKIGLLSIVLGFTCSVSVAQENLQVTEVQKIFSQGTHNGYSINIPQARLRDVRSDWKKYLRDKNKGDFDEVKGEYILSLTVVPGISEDSVMVYSLLTEYPAEVNLLVFVRNRDTTFYSSTIDPVISSNISTFIRNFAVNQYRNAVADELEEERKNLAKIEDDISDLEKDNEKMDKKIRSNEREIDRLNGDIKANLKEQEINADAIEHQQKIIATFLDKSDLKDEQEKKLKEMEKTKKKLQKKNESLHDDIDDLESENKSLKKKIKENESEVIPEKKNEKDKQRLKVANVEVKLKDIR